MCNQTFNVTGDIPNYLIYDDACRLRRFIENRNSNLPCNNRIAKITPDKIRYVVDKMHIKGHSEQWCLENCHPKLFPELDNVNTVVCEQTNFFVDNYKHILKYMNFLRFNFFLYIVLNEFNNIKIRNNVKNSQLCKTGFRCNQVKRKILTDDEEEEDDKIN